MLAITSGAFAADHYMITKSSQIKSGAVSLSDLSSHARKILEGNKGPAGAQGPKGDTGAAGAVGSKGDTGAAGAGSRLA